MKIRTALLGFTIAGMTALTASCSGSTDSNESGGGSSSTSTAGKGTAGSTAGTSSTAGASNNGGTSSTAGAANNGGVNTTAGRNNGGNANTGGFNLGGAGFDPADYMCGDPAPMKGAACTPGTQPCVDGTAVCYCQMSKWACMDILGGAGGAGPGGFGQLDCPATKPMSGGDCGDTLGVCPYGQGGCACYNGTWACN